MGLSGKAIGALGFWICEADELADCAAADGPAYAIGRYKVNVLPTPGALRNWISPPRRLDSSRLIASPNPVPPYLRLVLASACWNASKMIFCFSAGIPMPVSATSKATTVCAWLRIGCVEVQATGAAETLS